jgi:hypothetical protein
LDILVPGAVASAEVQYWTRGMTEAAAYEVGSITQQTDGSYVIECNVPNEFFDTWGDLRVYLVVTDDSKYVVTYEGRIKVLQREKPEDYVDDDPDNEALRVLTEAREAAQSASADADRAAQVAASIPADYSELSGNVSNLTGEVGQLNERLQDVDERVEVLEASSAGSGLTEDIKVALLQLASKVAYIDEDGQDYYDALEEALYPPANLVSISASYVQSGAIYDSDTLDVLKADLIVTAHWSDRTTSTVSSSDYVLSGILTTGTSTITVTYRGKTTSFNVTVTHATILYEITNTLTNVTNSNNSTQINENTPYSATLSAVQNYEIDNVVITMGGTDITSSSYNALDGSISIASVTGDITITASAARWDYSWIPTSGTFDDAGFTWIKNSGDVNYTNDGAVITGVKSTSTSPRITMPIDNTYPVINVEFKIVFLAFDTDGNSGFGTQFTNNGSKYSNIRVGSAYKTGQTEYGISRYSLGSWKELTTPQFNKNTEYTFRIEYNATENKFTVKVNGNTMLASNTGTGSNADANMFLCLAGRYTIKSLKVGGVS